MPPPLSQYYKTFAKSVAAAAGVIAALPLLSLVLPDDLASYVFPPLQNVFRIVAVALVVLVSYGIYWLGDSDFVQSRRQRPRVLWACFALSFLGALAFLASSNAVVRTVTPAEGAPITVTVGFTRTAAALKTFPHATDWQMLRARGPTEEEIEGLWTFASLITARLILFATYMLFACAAVAGFSLGALYTVTGSPTVP